MATYRFGNYWDEYDHSDLFLFTSNGVVKNSRLVMGAGTALQVRDRWSGIDLAIGRKILSDCDCNDKPIIYGLLISDRWPLAKIGAFQTKLHWRQNSNLDLIGMSASLLIQWCSENPSARVDLPMPGIGYGGLKLDVVLPIVDELPDQVNVWQLSE